VWEGNLTVIPIAIVDGMYHQPFHIIFAPLGEVQLSTIVYNELFSIFIQNLKSD